jgi:hypothetical protein
LFIDFAYNKSVHSTTDYSPFEIVYDFNSLTSLDLIHLPVDKKVSSFDDIIKVKMVKTLYDNARQYIEKKNMHLKLVEVINI